VFNDNSLYGTIMCELGIHIDTCTLSKTIVSLIDHMSSAVSKVYTNWPSTRPNAGTDNFIFLKVKES
jgi:hypothetical protein